MSPRTELPVEEPTRTDRHPDDEINSETKLRGDHGEKYTAEQPVLPAHSIYPETHLVQT